MIVRISGEGQYEVVDADVAALNKLDNAVVVACESTDEDRFHAAFGELLELVRTKGTLIPDDELTGSDIILPPSDLSLDEARTAFQGEGLIPG